MFINNFTNNKKELENQIEIVPIQHINYVYKHLQDSNFV